MLTATCHCGAIQVTVPGRPTSLVDCNCSICRRYGALWAYYNSDNVQVEAELGAAEAYAWGPKVLEFVRCPKCGCVTHWRRIEPVRGSKMGVNARNFEPAELTAVPVRQIDGAAWTP